LYNSNNTPKSGKKIMIKTALKVVPICGRLEIVMHKQ
jgi:hypothetical protein